MRRRPSTFPQVQDEQEPKRYVAVLIGRCLRQVPMLPFRGNFVVFPFKLTDEGESFKECCYIDPTSTDVADLGVYSVTDLAAGEKAFNIVGQIFFEGIRSEQVLCP